MEKVPNQVIVFILIKSIAEGSDKGFPRHGANSSLHGLVPKSSRAYQTHGCTANPDTRVRTTNIKEGFTVLDPQTGISAIKSWEL